MDGKSLVESMFSKFFSTFNKNLSKQFKQWLLLVSGPLLLFLALLLILSFLTYGLGVPPLLALLPTGSWVDWLYSLMYMTWAFIWTSVTLQVNGAEYQENYALSEKINYDPKEQNWHVSVFVGFIVWCFAVIMQAPFFVVTAIALLQVVALTFSFYQDLSALGKEVLTPLTNVPAILTFLVLAFITEKQNAEVIHAWMSYLFSTIGF